jgi:hypothetical protein
MCDLKHTRESCLQEATRYCGVLKQKQQTKQRGGQEVVVALQSCRRSRHFGRLWRSGRCSSLSTASRTRGFSKNFSATSSRKSLMRGRSASRWSCEFLTNQGALKAARRNLFCTTCSLWSCVLDTFPHTTKPYVMAGLTICR